MRQKTARAKGDSRALGSLSFHSQFLFHTSRSFFILKKHKKWDTEAMQKKKAERIQVTGKTDREKFFKAAEDEQRPEVCRVAVKGVAKRQSETAAFLLSGSSGPFSFALILSLLRVTSNLFSDFSSC